MVRCSGAYDVLVYEVEQEEHVEPILVKVVSYYLRGFILIDHFCFGII